MNVNSWFSKITFATCLSSLFLFPSHAKAQMVIETKAERGQAQAIITVTNTSNVPSRVRIYA